MPRINSRRAGTVRPCLRMPLTVGKRGSDQPSARPSLTNHVSCRLDMTVYTRFSRLKSKIPGSRIRSALQIHEYYG
jgi:hypothetical protein